MTTLKLDCLGSEIDTGTAKFPIFIGFKPAKEIAAASVAPMFGPEATNADIAQSVGPHTTKWQRPLSDARVKTIAETFCQAEGDDNGEIMPNPVLLAVTSYAQKHVALKKINGIYKIQIEYKDSEPLWILDGQHRIAGLAMSEQQDNELAFVLLLNLPEGDAVYTPATYAKLFAQVTTESVPLSKIHQEWLSASFKLNAYSSQQDKDRARAKAMRTTANLCYSGTVLNNRILFLPDAKKDEAVDAFAWPDYDWVGLIRDDYYRRAKNSPLAPEKLADALRASLSALRTSIPSPGHSAVFGKNPKTDPDAFGRKPVQQGIVSALLNYLAADPKRAALTPKRWRERFESMHVDTSDWDMRQLSTSGVEGSRAPRIICEAFLDGLESNGLQNNSSFSDWIFGVESPILRYRFMTVVKGEPDTASDKWHEVTLDTNIKDIALDSEGGKRRFLEFDVSSNMAGFALEDLKAGPTDGRLNGSKTDRNKAVRDIRTLAGDRTKELRVLSYLYGGEQRGVVFKISRP